MKQHFMILLMLLFIGVMSAVTWNVSLVDTYGDGWNGGLLTLEVNSVPVLIDITIAAGGGPEVFPFDVVDGDVVTTVYTAGSYPTENEYYIYDHNALLVASDGTGGGTCTGIPLPGILVSVATTPEFSINEPSWDFGQLQNGTTASKEFIITNSGVGLLDISSITISGTYFTLTANPAPVSLAGGISASFTVEYAPLASGTHTGQVTITDGRAVTYVDLDGICADPTVTTYPWIEDFEGTFLPFGWTKIIDETGPNDITKSSTQNATPGGMYCAQFSSYDTSSDYNQYLFSAPILVDAANTRLTFLHAKATTDAELLEWGIATDTNPASFTWTPVTLSNTAWQQTEVNLDAYIGQTVYIGFHYYGNYLYYVWLDDVTIDEYPAAPIFSLDPTVWDTGLTLINTSVSQEFTISNDGGGLLGITNISITGDYFTLTVNPAPVDLGPAASASFTVQYAPTVVGPHTGQVTITDGRAVTTVDLTGECFDPSITVFPWTETFEVASPSRAGWTQIQEIGVKVWTYATGAGGGLITTAHGGTLNAKFTASGGGPHVTKLVTPPLALAPATDYRVNFWYGQDDWSGDQNELRVYYRTDFVSPWVMIAEYLLDTPAWTEATLTLPTPSSTYQIAFEGTDLYGYANVLDDVLVEEIPAVPVFEIDLIAWDFGSVIINSTPTKDFTITNVGGGTIDVTSIATTDLYYSILVDPTPVSLGAGQSAVFTVQYAPLAVGTHTGTVTINDGRSKAATTVDLTGACYDPTIYTFPYAESFNDVAFPPVGWLNMRTAGTGNPGTWNRATTGTSPTCTPFAGAAMIRYNCYSLSTGTQGIMATPPIAFGADAYRVKFHMYRDTGYATKLNEGVKVHYNTVQSLAGATQIGYIHRPIGLSPVVPVAGWYEYVFDLPTSGVNGYVIFEALSEYGNNIFVDEVSVYVAPTTPLFEVTPSVKDFGIVNLGSVASQVFTIKNIGVGTLGINSVVLGGGGGGMYTVEDLNAYPLGLLENESIVVTVSLTPTLEGTFETSLVINDDLGGKAEHIVAITGIGSDAVNYGGGEESTPFGGYYFANNVSVGAPTTPYFAWITQTENAVDPALVTGTTDDGYWGPIPVGFEFLYYGNSYNTVYIGTNGIVTFGAGSSSLSNSAIPLASAPNNLLALFWDDMRYFPGTTNIYYGGSEYAFTITYENLGRYASTYNPLLSVTAQVTLYADGKIRMQYLDVTGTTYTATIGIENADGTKGVQYHYNGVGGPWGTEARIGGIAIVYGDDPWTLPVGLSSFTAVLTANMQVQIDWVAESETNHLGYNVLRNNESELSTAYQLNQNIIDDGQQASTQVSYSFTDTEIDQNTTYHYWLQSMDLDGAVQYFGPLTVNVGTNPDDPELPYIPLVTRLMDAFPNPFNPSTNLRFEIKDAGRVSIDIYNTRGQRIRSFDNEYAQPGYYQLVWDGKDANGSSVGSGVYFYQMKAGKYSDTKKMLLTK